MGWLATLASLLGLELEVLVARLRRNAIAWSIVGALVVIALVFLLAALNAALTTLMGPVWAPLAIAGGALLAALGIYLVLRSADAAAARRETERRKAERTALTTSAILTALPMAMRLGIVRKLGLPVGGALAAAYLLARVIHAREPDDTSGDDDVARS
jgi:hypothetical protein